MAAADKKTTYTAAEVAVLESTIQAQQSQIHAQQAQIDELKRKLEHMNEVFANAQRARFGQSSEKKSYVLEEGQMNFFNEAEDCQDHKAEEPTEDTLTVKAHARKKKRTIDELAKNLPVEEVVFELQESQLTCDKCVGTFKLIGKKLVRRELVIIPQQEKILEYYSCTYACDKCEKDTGFAHILTTKTPPPLMKHSLASPSTVADVMTKKYVDGIPLARQEKIWAREGVELSRATLANWVIQCTCYPSNYPRLESSDYLGNNRQNQCGQMTNRSIICGSEVALFAVKKLASDTAVTSTRDSSRNPSL